MVRHAALGALLGGAWGVAARVWMRLVATDPEFSWSGTLSIVGLAAVAGLGLGVVAGARARRRTRWWRLAAVTAFPMVAAPMGALFFLPAFVLGGPVVAGRGTRLWRGVCLALTVPLPLLGWWALPADERLLLNPVSTVGGMWLLMSGIAYGAGALFGRWPDRLPRGDRGAVRQVPVG